MTSFDGMMASSSPDDFIKSAVMKENEPSSDELVEDDEFVVPRRKKKHNPTDRQTSCLTREIRKAENSTQIFVAWKAGVHIKDSELRDIFCRFGIVQQVSVHDKNGMRYAFIMFSEADEALAATQAGEVMFGDQILRVERRRGHSRGIGDQGKAKMPPDPEVNWRQLLRDFDWRLSAAKYIFRTVTMEDYCGEYIHALGCFRGKSCESARFLSEKLIKLSDSSPTEDLDELMPPSISGLVYNKTTLNDKGSAKMFDVAALLKASPKLFKVDKTYVYYKEPLITKAEASKRLKEILVEGLFIYFFAKFCHGPTFKIKYSYYQRSEPIRTTLLRVTGERNVNVAINVYFELFNEIFRFDESTHELTLTRDYFSKAFRESLRPFLSASVGETTCTDEAMSSGTSNGEDFVEGHEGVVECITGSKAMIRFELGSDVHWALLPRAVFDEKPKGLKTNDRVIFDATASSTNLECHWVCSRACLSPSTRAEPDKGMCFKGVVRSIVKKKSGFITFSIDGRVEEAYFCLENICLDEAKTSSDVGIGLSEGDEVFVEVVRQPPKRDVAFKAVRVWPCRNDETLRRLIGEKLDGFLEPSDIFTTMEYVSDVDSNNNDDGIDIVALCNDDLYYDMPQSVRSVVSVALRDDFHLKTLTNPAAVEDLLNEIENNEEYNSKRLDRSSIKVEFEKESRAVFSRIVFEKLK